MIYFIIFLITYDIMSSFACHLFCYVIWMGAFLPGLPCFPLSWAGQRKTLATLGGVGLSRIENVADIYV